MRFNLKKIEKNLKNAQDNIDNSINLNTIKLSNTYLDSTETICELYILFILFTIFPIKNIKLTEYDVD